MDQVDQHDAAARLAPPGAGAVEVVCRLEKQAQPGDGGELAEAARLDDLAGALDQRAVAAVVADQDGDPGLLRRFDELKGALYVAGNGFLQQHRHARLDGREAVRNVKLIGRGDHHAVRLDRLQSLLKVRKGGHAQSFGLLLRLGGGVDDAGKLRLRFFADALDVRLSDHTRSGDGDANGLRHVILSMADRGSPSPVTRDLPDVRNSGQRPRSRPADRTRPGDAWFSCFQYWPRALTPWPALGQQGSAPAAVRIPPWEPEPHPSCQGRSCECGRSPARLGPQPPRSP